MMRNIVCGVRVITFRKSEIIRETVYQSKIKFYTSRRLTTENCCMGLHGGARKTRQTLVVVGTDLFDRQVHPTFLLGKTSFGNSQTFV